MHRTAHPYIATKFDSQLDRQMFKQLTVRTVIEKTSTDCTKSP